MFSGGFPINQNAQAGFGDMPYQTIGWCDTQQSAQYNQQICIFDIHGDQIEKLLW